MMRLRCFQWSLHAQGPDLHAWPERERLAALALLRQSAPARQMLADAFARDAQPAPDPAGQCRMLARLRGTLCPATPASAGMRLGALAACALAGWLLGAALDRLDVVDLFLPDLLPNAAAGLQVAVLP